MKRSHLFHIINPSPWPLFLTVSTFNVLFNIILWLNSAVVTNLNFVWTIFVFFLVFDSWCRDIIREATYEGMHSSYVQEGLKMVMLLFIVSEVMFFFSFFWGYLHYFLAPAIEIGAIWPPYAIQVFNYTHIPLYNTFVLLVSGVTVTWCHHEIVKGNWNSGKRFTALLLTILLACHFTYWQIKEYNMSSFNMTDSVYGSIFYMATGFHGFHVIIGTLFLSICLCRLLYQEFSKSNHIGLEFAIWYWHFVDVVWLILYILIYFKSDI